MTIHLSLQASSLQTTEIDYRLSRNDFEKCLSELTPFPSKVLSLISTLNIQKIDFELESSSCLIFSKYGLIKRVQLEKQDLEDSSIQKIVQLFICKALPHCEDQSTISAPPSQKNMRKSYSFDSIRTSSSPKLSKIYKAPSTNFLPETNKEVEDQIAFHRTYLQEEQVKLSHLQQTLKTLCSVKKSDHTLEEAKSTTSNQITRTILEISLISERLLKLYNFRL